MNLKTLLLAFTYTLVLAACVPVSSQESFMASASISQQTQKTTISLASEQLKNPYYLKVSTAGTDTQLTGQIKLNGKPLQTLSNNCAINFSPYLTSGTHAIEISGSYYPASDSVRIDFVGPDTEVGQQTGGSGDFNQTLIIQVQ
jgi:hypothetical protein